MSKVSSILIGFILGISGFLLIKRNRDVNEKVRLSENRIRTLINHLQAGLVIIDKQGEVQALNPSAEVMFGENVYQNHCRSLLKLKNPEIEDVNFMIELFSSTLNRTSKATCLDKAGMPFEAQITMSEVNTQAGPIYMLQILSLENCSELDI